MELKTVTAEDMLEITGSYGLYQWIINMIFCVMQIPQAYQILIMYFAALSPSWKCSQNSTICNTTDIFLNDDNKRCSMNRADWEYTEPKTFSVTTQFDLVCDREWLISFSSSIFFIGWVFGASILGSLTDRYGRKTIYFPSTAVMIIVGFFTAFSPNVTILIILRFIAGFTVPGTYIQAIILMSELVNAKKRAFAGLVIFIFFTASLCLVGLKAYFIREWKYLFISCTAPYAFILLFYPFVPESIEWLVINGKTEKLKVIFEKISKLNKKIIPEDVVLKTNNIENPPSSTFFDLFRKKSQLISTLVQGYAWMINGMVYYGLSLAADDLGGNLYRNYILNSIVEIPGVVTAIYFCNKIGRKKTIVSTLFFASALCLPISFIPHSSNIRILRVVFGITGKYFVSISFNSLYTWSCELFPTVYRGKGMGFLQVTARIGAATSPFVVKLLKTVHHTLPFLTMGILGLIAVCFQFVLPETKEKTSSKKNDQIEMKQKSDLNGNKITPQA